jgi:hypothetical protein
MGGKYSTDIVGADNSVRQIDQFMRYSRINHQASSKMTTSHEKQTSLVQLSYVQLVSLLKL